MSVTLLSVRPGLPARPPPRALASAATEPSQSSYPNEMTGDPWVDGAIYARGAKESGTTAHVQLSEVPYALSLRLGQRLRALGVRTNLREEPLFLRSQMELVLNLKHTRPAFATLPMYRDRRLRPDHPQGFLEGYLQFCALLVTPAWRPSLHREFPRHLQLAPWRANGTVEDVRAALAQLGVGPVTEHRGALYVPSSIWRGIPFLNEVGQLLEREEREALGPNPASARAELLDHVGEAVHGTHPTLALLDELVRRHDALLSLWAESPNERDRQARPGMTVRLRVLEEYDAGLWTDYRATAPESVWAGANGSVLEPRLLELLGTYQRAINELFSASFEFKALQQLVNDIGAPPRRGVPDHAVASRPQLLFSSKSAATPLVAQFLVDVAAPELFERTTSYTIRRHPAFAQATEDLPRAVARARQTLSRLGLDAYRFFRGLRFPSNEEGLPDRALSPCPSCNRPLALSAGRTCAACRQPLCLECQRQYSPRRGVCACRDHGRQGVLPSSPPLTSAEGIASS